jgi:8-oxo-dGTP diphosphatase
MNKPIPVVCAIILENGRLFCAQRKAGGSLALKWELPGGKIESNEDPIAALHRESNEELGWEVEPIESWPTYEHSYSPEVLIALFPIVCRRVSFDEPVLVDHAQSCWMPVDQLLELDWAAADVPIVRDIMSRFKSESC